MRLDRGLLPSMIERGSGVIVHIVDSASHCWLTLAYAAAEALSPSTANVVEQSVQGVRVLTVSPGFIETDAATRMIERQAEKDNSGHAEAQQKLMAMLGASL